MSFEDVDYAIKAVITSRKGVTVPTMKLVLIAIAQHTSAQRGDHHCFPALKRLSKMTGLSTASVSRAIDALAEFGAFKEYSRGGGRKRSNYVINIAKLSSIGIDWLKSQGSSGEPSSNKADGQNVEGSAAEPRVHLGNPKFTRGTQRSSGEGQGSAGEPNKVLNLGINPALYQGSVSSTDSLRSSGAPSALSSHSDEKKNMKPTPTPKSSGVSGFQAKDKSKPNPGQRLAEPYQRKCPKCNAPWERDKNHVCAKPVYCTCSAESNGNDEHEYFCAKVRAKAAAAGKSLLGTVDEL